MEESVNLDWYVFLKNLIIINNKLQYVKRKNYN